METIIYMGYNLSVLITEIENDNAQVEYFINGMQIKDWGKVKPDFQALFTALSDIVCKTLCLTKWSY